MGKRITVKEVNERVNLLRQDFDQLKGEIETLSLAGRQASLAGQGLSDAMGPLYESIKGIEGVVNRLLERVKKLENKRSWWKFWQKKTKS